MLRMECCQPGMLIVVCQSKAWDSLTMVMASYLHLLVWLDKAGMFCSWFEVLEKTTQKSCYLTPRYQLRYVIMSPCGWQWSASRVTTSRERERERRWKKSKYSGCKSDLSRTSRTGTPELYRGKFVKNPLESLCLSSGSCNVIIFRMSFSTDRALCVKVSSITISLLFSPLLKDGSSSAS